ELPDGRLVVLDRFRVWVFDSTGRELLRTGTRGEGPGEFRNIDAACPIGRNALLVQDGANRRFTLVSLADGGILKSVNRDRWRMAQGCRSGDSRVLVYSAGSPSAAGGPGRII